MLAGIRSRLTYANVMATLAVFIAVGGGAYAASKIGPNDIKENAIRSKHVKDGQIKPADLAEIPGGRVGVLTSRFFVAGSFDLPTGYGPVSGMADGNGSATESAFQTVSPAQDLVARDMVAYFDFISNNGGRRLILRVNGADTALQCETTANFASASCSPPADTEVDIPAGSKLAWKTDRGSASFNTAETMISASLVLKKE